MNVARLAYAESASALKKLGVFATGNMSNLLVAGRCISAESEAAGAIRVMPPCMGLGQAAGTAAGIAVQNGTDLRKLDVTELRKNLAEQGVVLNV